LVLGQNIKTGNLVQNHSGRFHRYRVASQTNSQAWQGKTIPATAQPDVSLIDPAIRAPRELVIWEDSATEAECRKRCEYERASRRGQGEGIEYSVAGWLQQAPSPGVTTRLWTAGETVPVYDPYMEIDAELLIKDVTLAFDDQQGHHSLITVTHPDALLAEPEATEESLEGMGWDCKFDANGRSACEHPADLAEAQQ
jgi:prophage tail gpP-like protein